MKEISDLHLQTNRLMRLKAIANGRMADDVIIAPPQRTLEIRAFLALPRGRSRCPLSVTVLEDRDGR